MHKHIIWLSCIVFILVMFSQSTTHAQEPSDYQIFLPVIFNSIPPKSDGIYQVGVNIRPGKWHSTGTGNSCYWARYDSNQNILDNHFGLAGCTVTIRPTDYEVELNHCGTWEYVENKPLVLQPGASEPKGDGFYTAGIEIVPGKWRSTGTGSSCYWARYDGYQNILEPV